MGRAEGKWQGMETDGGGLGSGRDDMKGIARLSLHALIGQRGHDLEVARVGLPSLVASMRDGKAQGWGRTGTLMGGHGKK